jgi:hypothetical protein
MINEILEHHKNPKVYSFLKFSLFYTKKYAWIRLFNMGLSFKDVSIHGLTFSERSGFKKRIQIANWSISFEKW